MGMYKYIRETWKKNDSRAMQERLIQWRREPTSLRIERPTRLDRARSLGYKAKQGIIVVRQRVSRGGRQRPNIKHARRSKHAAHRKVLDKSYQQVAEERAAKSFKNCEVLNSYYLAKDGKNYWYEVILLERFHPQILSNPKLNKVTSRRGRAARGLTSAGRRSRNLIR